MKVLVTGGGGFLGGALVRELARLNHQVVSLQRGTYPELEQANVTAWQGDMTDTDTVVAASRGCEVVYHVAGLTGVWGPYEDYYHTNVTGTESVIHACLQNGIRRLVYTSSPSVIFDGKDEENVDESMPYPDRYYNNYQRTKSTAEQLVLASNNSELATVALRPHLIWGPGDPHLVGRIINRAHSGKLRLVRGRQNLVDTTYIDNAVDAHIAAGERLAIGSPCSGKTYFITNGEPVTMAVIINGILAAVDMPTINRTVSADMLYNAGMLSELIYRLFNINNEPLMTRFIARQLSCAHWYNINAARNDLGYRPRVSIAQGLKKLEAAYRESDDHLA